MTHDFFFFFFSEFPVPENILPAYFFRDDFDEMEEEDDHLCLEALLEAENTLQ